ncbi:Guanine nucleotide exchange factor subunit RIC1 [Spathaspora sp. JA1]|nr:Guanine nucleotide exchange factor subunit RIC1 [Spathaspora sp. JA1]
MVWINGCPQFSIDSPITHEDIIQIIHIPHTPLVVVLTPTSVYIFHQFTLLPLTSHIRTLQSIENNGNNLILKVKHVSVNTSKFQKLTTINLFIQTDLNYLIIYQCQINYSKSLYEVHNSNNELIQTGLPLSDTSLKFSISGLIKSATKTIIHGNEESLVNLENVENINNASLEDELGNSSIEFVKISIFKILKIGIKLQKFWLQQNSHYLIIFNNEETEQQDSRFQIVNIFNFKTELLQSSDFTWYKDNAKIVYIKFNVFFNYFLFVNNKRELWFMEFEKENKEIITKGHKLLTFDIEEEELASIKFWFNPQCQLVIIRIKHELRMYKMEFKSIEFLKILHENISRDSEINWSPCGNYFVNINPNTGYWKLCSKFGNITFNSEEILQELDEHDEDNRKFLKASIISISGNSMNLYLLNHNKSKLYYINLVRIISDTQRGLLYDNEYISIIQNNRKLIRFPILPKFKKFLLNQEVYNGNINKSIKSATGKICLCRNDFNQISISYGDCLSISTPYCSGDDRINHILWFNFKSYFADSINIVRHFWFKDYLLIVNRKSKHAFTEDDNKTTNSNDHLVDEFIVFDTTLTKYGMGGEDISFTSDALLWKYDFKTTFTDIQIGTDINDKQTCHVVIVTSDYRLIVLDLTMDKTVSIKNDQNKFYKIFISVRKTILLSSIKNKVNLDDIIQTTMVNNRHFLFLLNTGDLYLLKNQSQQQQQSNRQGSVVSNSSMNSGSAGNNLYDLIKLNINIEFFKFKTIRFSQSSIIDFIYLFNSEHILIYDINELIDKSYDRSVPQESSQSMLLDDYDDELHPIIIDSQGMHPIKLDSILEIGGEEEESTYKSLDLIGLESFAMYRQTTGGLIIKNRVAHKLILNNFIEFDLLYKGDLESSFYKYKQFKNFHYCLELLLFKNLTMNQSLKRLCQLIEFTDNAEFIYINCLRKIEADYWNRFFEVLQTTPVKFMNRLIEIDNVELCYNYLIIYLNYKSEGEEEGETNKKDQLNSDDIQVILKIIKMLDKSGKWDWCFQLCRFIKLLEPTGNLLVQIQQELSQ